MNNSIWINGLRTYLWIVFVAIVIAGIVIGSLGGGFLGFLLGLIIAVPGAFLITAISMVALDAAADIRAIRNTLCNAATNTASTAKVPPKPESKKNADVLKNGWKCDNCGKINPPDVDFCSCFNPDNL